MKAVVVVLLLAIAVVAQDNRSDFTHFDVTVARDHGGQPKTITVAAYEGQFIIVIVRCSQPYRNTCLDGLPTMDAIPLTQIFPFGNTRRQRFSGPASFTGNHWITAQYSRVGWRVRYKLRILVPREKVR